MDNANPDSIEEPLFPRNATTYWSMFLTLELGAVLLSSMLVLPLSWPHFGDAAFGYGIAALALAPLCLIFARTQLDYFQTKCGRIVFDGESISIYFTNDPGKEPEYVVKLTECRWFVGNRTWATLPTTVIQQVTPFGLERFLMIEFPARFQTPEVFVGHNRSYAPGPVIVAVGQDPLTRQRWEDAFYRLGVDRDECRETEFPPLSEMFGSFFIVFLAVASFVLFLWISRGMELTLNRLGIPDDIVLGIVWPLFLFGGLMGTVFCFAIFAVRQSQHAVRRPDLSSGYGWSFVLLVVVYSAMFLIPLWRGSVMDELGFTREAKVAATITVIGLGMMACCLIRPFLFACRRR